MSGCEAAVVVKAKAKLVFEDIWQGMAEGMELARKNPHSAPVHAIMTDAHTWYFFGLQSVQKGSTADLQAGDAGGAAGGAGVQGAGSARGLEFSFGSSKEAFRLFDCAVVYAEVLGRNTCSSEAPTSALRAVEVMYRLYTALHPHQDISRLPELVQQADAEAKQAADEWAEVMVGSLERQEAKAVAAARIGAEVETERRLRQETEAAREQERRQRKEAEARVQVLEQQLQQLQQLVARGAGDGHPAGTHL